MRKQARLLAPGMLVGILLASIVSAADPHGYGYGNVKLVASRVTLADLDLLKKTVLFGPEDEQYLKMAGEVLAGQVDSVLDLWYGFVGSNPHLLTFFAGADGKPSGPYLEAVRKRFAKWIMDTCTRRWDQSWLDWQYEIALRHHASKKNRTDSVTAAPQVNQRYLTAFVYPLTATMKPFLAKKGHAPEEVEKMHQAWFKAVVITAALWSYPYVREGEF